ncbi:MAG TPA: GAF domain-containing protein, partial [Terriglobales bacterium]|nr:GAF domain-containing protein [Terriglobales bacterium]
AQGAGITEIRIPLGAGIAGSVALSGEIINIPDAYADPRFNREVDKRTGYTTRSILCMPMKDASEKIIGVFQLLNKESGAFTAEDEQLLQAFAAQAGIAVRNAILNEEIRKRMEVSETLLKVMKSVASELHIDELLKKIVNSTSEVMCAERASLFLIDPKTGDLWSKVAQGMDAMEIRIPIGVGIAGHVAMTGETINIEDAYADSRFNPEIDKRSGFRTRSMLCMPLRNDAGEVMGVMQVLNKLSGTFSEEDERLLNALGSQISISIENSRLFERVVFMQNYNSSILGSIATGVVTLGPDGRVIFINSAAEKIFSSTETGKMYDEFFNAVQNAELTSGVSKVLQGSESEYKAYHAQFLRADNDAVNANFHVLPLRDPAGKNFGLVVVADDITQEKRLMSTLCRYVTREVAERVLADRDKLKLGGDRQTVAVLFADIRNFTSISEKSTAEEIVGMLNDYFTRMMEPVFRYEGMLDKFIGDAMMAVFGAPVARQDDAQRAVMAALEMRRILSRYNRQRVARGLQPIQTGIGITKGEAITGNIGSEQRMDYTVIGDTVNVASRLESLTKSYEYKILINDQVYEDIKDRIACVDLGFAQIKGKGEGVHIYGVEEPLENRVFHRVARHFEVCSGIGDQLVTGEAIEISEGGMSFRTRAIHQPDSELDLHCKFGSEWVQFRSIVRRAGEATMGVEFLNVSPLARTKLIEFLNLKTAAATA